MGYVADVHVASHRVLGGPEECTLNRRARDCLETLGRAAAAALAEGCAALVVLGDLFDDDRPSPQLVAAVQQVVLQSRGPRPGPALHWVLLVGNHDQRSDAPGDHALGPLRAHATVVDAPCIVPLPYGGGYPADLVLLPHSAAAPAEERLREALGRLASGGGGRHRLLGLHAGIEDDEAPPFLRGARDAVRVEQVQKLMRAHGVDAAFAGNWHNHKVWDGPVAQCGALVPTGFDNPGEGYGRLVVWDSDGPQVHVKTVPHPVFVAARSVEALSRAAKAARAARASRVYARVTVSRETLAEARRAVGRLVAKGVVDDAEIDVDGAEAEAAARSAAGAARSAETFQEALAGFVGRMELPEGVERADVLARAKGYLA